jgi:hypothetical protein
MRWLGIIFIGLLSGACFGIISSEMEDQARYERINRELAIDIFLPETRP